MQRHGLGTGRRDGAGDLDDAVGVGAQLGPARPAGDGRRGDDGGRQLGVVGEDRVAALEVRARQVDLDGDDLRRRDRQQLGGAGVVVDRATPDRRHHRGPGAQQVGQHVVEPVRHAGALQPDGVEHPLGRRVQPRRRVAGPLERGERLDDHGAERRQVHVARQLGRRTRPCPTPSSPGSSSSTDPMRTLASPHTVLEDICGARSLRWLIPARGAPAGCGPRGAGCAARRGPGRRRARRRRWSRTRRGGACRPCGSARRRCGRPCPRGVLTTKVTLPAAIRSTAVLPSPSLTLPTTSSTGVPKRAR